MREPDTRGSLGSHEQGAVPGPVDSRERKTVLLVVEPDREIRTLLRLALRKEFEVVAAADEGEAIQAMESYPSEIRMILLNVTRLGEPALTRSFRREKLGRDVPVIGIGERTAADQVRAVWFGCDGYLSKPFYTRELRERIASCMPSENA